MANRYKRRGRVLYRIVKRRNGKVVMYDAKFKGSKRGFRFKN